MCIRDRVIPLPVARTVRALAPVLFHELAVNFQLVGGAFIKAREIAAQHHKNAKEILTRTASTEPTLEDIAKETGIPKEDIVFARDAIQSPLSCLLYTSRCG